MSTFLVIVDSSIWTVATFASTISTAVLATFSTPPNPVSMSTRTGKSVALTKSLALSHFSRRHDT